MATRWKPPKIEVTDIDLFRAKVILTSEATRDLFNGIIDDIFKPDDEAVEKVLDSFAVTLAYFLAVIRREDEERTRHGLN
jgi:hypothetical protein